MEVVDLGGEALWSAARIAAFWVSPTKVEDLEKAALRAALQKRFARFV